MLTTPRLVRETDPVEVARSLLGVRGAALMVVDAAEQLVGIVMRGDLRGREDSEGERGLLVGDVAVRNLVTAAPDETLRVAVRRMNRISVRQLPVVESALPAPPAGLRRRQDVLSPNERSLGESASSAEAQRQQAVERTMAAEDGARAASDAE
jgi:predicted transcriptional regulator